ncbi:MAG: class I SAM-dependent methyltransferase [Acidobacteria bacterium]|nr:class I SAM-dependent methyltransferase [Acidobacteriota bacterium]
MLAWIHEFLCPATYIEIGVWAGESLRLAQPPTRAVGIDPTPVVKTSFVAETRVFPVSSDEFFQSEAGQSVFDGQGFDLAFVDGSHLFEQVLRDFIHLEPLANPGSVVLLHDCIPLDPLTSERTRSTFFYTGDVWKAVLCLRRNRPDLEMTIVPAAPSGLCLVRGLDPGSRILAERFEGLVGQYINVRHSYYLDHLKEMPSRIPNLREAVRVWCLKTPI